MNSNVKKPIKISDEIGIIGYLNNLDRNSPLLKIDRNVFKETNKSKSDFFELIAYRVSSQNKRVPNLIKIRKQPQIIGAGPIVHEHGDIFTVLTQYISVSVNKATTQKEWEEILKNIHFQ